MVINCISFIIAYFVCSINFFTIISSKFKNINVKKYKSITSIIKLINKFNYVFKIVFDILKSIIAYYLILFISNLFKLEADTSVLSVYLIGAVIGSCYPIYYKFKGSRGITTIVTCMMIIDIQITIVVIISSVIVMLVTKIVSLGNIAGIILLFIMTFIMLPEYIIPIFIITCIILYKHKEKIYFRFK